MFVGQQDLLKHLPPGWKASFSVEHKRYYYYCPDSAAPPQWNLPSPVTPSTPSEASPPPPPPNDPPPQDSELQDDEARFFESFKKKMVPVSALLHWVPGCEKQEKKKGGRTS